MSKHTPGPWVWGKHYTGLYGADPDNAVLSHAPYEGMWLSYGESMEANARLIAAAPELLEMLRRCLNHVENPRLFSCVRNVILKVDGRDTGTPPGCQGPGPDHAHIWVQPWKDSTEMRCARCGVGVKVEERDE